MGFDSNVMRGMVKKQASNRIEIRSQGLYII
jgi:hypothetical protein